MVFGVGQFNGVIYIYPRSTPVAMATKFATKIGYSSAYVRNICEIFASVWGFSVMGHRTLSTESFPERPSLPWQWHLVHNKLELGLCER